MTLRDVDWRIKAIGERKEIQLKLDASLHGMSLENSKQAESSLTKKESDSFDVLMASQTESGRRE